jgi:hypothetical protein
MAHPSQHRPRRHHEPSQEAADALAAARIAMAEQRGRVDQSRHLVAELRRQRRENHFGELVECAVAAAASADPEC